MLEYEIKNHKNLLTGMLSFSISLKLDALKLIKFYQKEWGFSSRTNFILIYLSHVELTVVTFTRDFP